MAIRLHVKYKKKNFNSSLKMELELGVSDSFKTRHVRGGPPHLSQFRVHGRVSFPAISSSSSVEGFVRDPPWIRLLVTVLRRLTQALNFGNQIVWLSCLFNAEDLKS
jgi:hypothetical protein